MMRSTKLLKPALAAVSVLAIGALVAAVWFGFGWGHALFSDKPAAAARDDALTGARQAAINLNTVDSGNLDQTFANMESSITGDEMLNALAETKDQMAEQVKQTGAKSEAHVLDAALTAMSRDEGTANSLVVLTTTTTWPNKPTSKVKITMRIGLTDVDGVWKASKVENVGQPLAMDPGTPAPAPAPAPVPEGAPAPAPESGGQ
ncbi:putative mce associated protein Mas4A [Rhodococcus sp. MTM3W5.2]|nr:putative mce associated protein Mas4A [Rhodococcus sp. MTM3W5.2]